MRTHLFPFLIALGLTGAAPPNAFSQCLVDPASAVACWKGDGNATDLSGLYPATWTGTPTYTPGKVGSAFRLDGTSSLRVNDADGLSPGVGGAFTAEAWVNPGVWSGTVLAKGSGTGLEYSLALNRTNGTVMFSMVL
ncbi:MAG: hypothetical protein QOF48_3994, partial [Verrucomicrobiota bacterium]